MSISTSVAAPRRPRQRQLVRMPWPMMVAFLTPALALYTVFVLYPIVQSTRYSLYDWNGLEKLDNFVGLDNFRRAFSDENFTAALKHNVIIIVLSVLLQIPFALGLAMLLNARIKGRALLRTLFFAPYVLSEVVTGVVWRQILRPKGLLDEMMTSVGLGAHTQGWLSDPDVVLYALFFVISWKYFGFHMVLLLAGLQQIPKELGEAASIDGATAWQRFRYVTLPLLGPTIRVSVFLSIIGALQLFDIVWVTTKGGPIGASSTMATYLYDQFRKSLFGYASAVSIVIFALSLVVALLYQRFALRRATCEGLVSLVDLGFSLDAPVDGPLEAPRRRVRLDRLGLYVVAMFVLGIIILPLTFSVLGGFRSNKQLVETPVGLPDPWVFKNYTSILTSGSFWRQVWNSTFIALAATFVVLPAASMAAFVMSRYSFRGRELVYGLFTLGLLFPAAVAILPLFITLRQAGLLSNPLGVALPQAAFGLPIAIVIMRPFFRAIPQEIQDAAAIDGCGAFRFYWSVMLPLSRPVLSTVAVITIVGSWNSFLLPLLVLIDPNEHTLPIGVNNISSQYTTDFARVLAYTTLSMIPALIFYSIAERQIIGGLTAGAVRE